jgi:hypothetical protein
MHFSTPPEGLSRVPVGNNGHSPVCFLETLGKKLFQSCLHVATAKQWSSSQGNMSRGDITSLYYSSGKTICTYVYVYAVGCGKLRDEKVIHWKQLGPGSS